MGSTNNINETNISLQIEGKECGQCQRPFNKKDVEERNYEINGDTSNDVRLIPMKDIGEKMIDRGKVADFNKDYGDLLYYPFGRSGYQFSIGIRSINHQDCEEWKEGKEN